MNVEDFGFHKKKKEEAAKATPFLGELPIGSYGKLLAEKGQEEFNKSFEDGPNGGKLVPANLIRETIAVVALEMLSWEHSYPQITDQELLPVIAAFSGVIELINRSHQGPEIAELFAIAAKAFQA